MAVSMAICRMDHPLQYSPILNTLGRSVKTVLNGLSTKEESKTKGSKNVSCWAQPCLLAAFNIPDTSERLQSLSIPCTSTVLTLIHFLGTLNASGK